MKQLNSVGKMWNLYKMGGVTPAIASMLGSQNAQQMAQIRNMSRSQRKRSIMETKLSELDIVVFDLETTGFSSTNGDEIISFGAVAVKGGVVQENETFHTLVSTKRMIPPFIEQLTGITNDMVQHAPELIDALDMFMQFVGRRVLVAHASGHDKQFLNQALWRTSKTTLNHRVIDTMMLAKWLEPALLKYDLDTLLTLHNIPILQRHHALYDSLMTAQLWIYYMDQIQQRKNVKTLHDLYAYLSQH